MVDKISSFYSASWYAFPGKTQFIVVLIVRPRLWYYFHIKLSYFHKIFIIIAYNKNRLSIVSKD